MWFNRITMGNKKKLLLFLCFTCFLHKSDGQCQIGDTVLGFYEQRHEHIQDIFRGNIISSSTTNIGAISSTSYGGGLENSPSYLDISLVDSMFTVQTTSAFDQYEENETAMSIPVTINFQCTGGGSSTLLLFVNIEDTNNNYPEFIPTNEFEFVLAPPLPPGFLITGCLNEITVKDIDLTTSSIIFELEENPYFQIEYDAIASETAGPKLFKARLSTTTFIRTLKDPIALRITATDVDATGDPPLSASGIIRISGDTEFEFPEEPVFSETFYFATYTNEHVITHDTISLQQGFDDDVDFTLDGEYERYFNAFADGNRVILEIKEQLPIDVFLEKQIYLIVRADREYTSGDSATIVINLPEETPLLFESALYEGSIVDNSLQLAPLVLSQGYEGSTVSARIVGEYSSSFTARVEGNLVTVTMDPLTNSIIGDNGFISMPVVASKDRSEATAIVTLEIIKDDDITPVFDESIYTGSYDPVNGLSLGKITFVQGYDSTVSVDLYGDHKDLFEVHEDSIDSSIYLTASTIPQELFEEQQITLRIEAAKPRTVGAKAAIIINLPAPRKLAFEEPLYRGTILNGELSYQTILLSDGYDVEIAPTGEYATYFRVSINAPNQVTITFSQALPESVIIQNNDITLTLIASGRNAIPTTTSLLLEIIKEDATTPVLNQKIYQETYSGPTDFEIGNIFLTQGFDDKVTFKLDDSAHAQYFEISNPTGNLATIRLRSAIPVDVIFNEKVLLFNVIADKPLTVGSHAAVIIRFPEELTEPTVMRFSENSYVGAIEHDQITFSEDIILSTGYIVGTNIELNGDLKDYFEATLQGDAVTVTLRSPISEQSIPANKIIVLEVEASAPQSVTAHTTLVVEYVVDVTPIVELIFAQPFYTGTYTEADGLTFTTPISLLDGYDANVQFDLDGGDSQWFTLVGPGNSQELSLLTPIPPEVLQNNRQLVFVVEALRPGSTTTTATIVISLIDELIEPTEMRFSENFYVGALERNEISFSNNIILSTGYVIETNVELFGDLRDYFEATLQEATVTVVLRSPIPEQSIPANRIIILEMEASAPSSTTAHATLVIEYVVDGDVSPVVELIFAQPFYTGTYTDADGLIFTTPISLTDGYDGDVQFDLNGDDSRWFTLVGSGNSQVLSVLNPIPAPVLQNNQQLVFVIEALRPGSTTTKATIVISLTAEYTEGLVLGFDQITYRGSLENNQVSTVTPITISEGYVPGVQVTLHGDLRDYFETNLQGATVTVTLRSPIPEQSIPANRMIILEMEASAPSSTPAHATLVMEYVVEVSPVVELIFAQPFYTGTYTDADGLIFTTPISLTDGYDGDVQFDLNGDDSRWFTLVGSGNSQILSVLSPIPAPVLQNNQQLVFVVEALRPGSTTTTATIVISLTAEYTEGLVLGFDQITYRGSLENNQVSTVTPITISEGYVPGVQVTLHGDLRDYFETNLQGATVTVTLRSPIPEQSIPANRMIILEMEASAPSSTPAHATLVMEYVVEVSPVVELIFAQPFYTGTYTDTDGLIFTTPISLTDGYDGDVQFDLNGDDSRWFTLVGSGNSQVLSVLSPIPAPVLQNNQQLVFVVEALRPGSTTTTATIVISLTAEYTEGLVLGFDQITYRGSLENNQVSTVTPITISEGYVPGVQVTLHGDLRDYFETNLQGATVTVTLRSPIPEQSIPANRMIILEMEASAPSSTPAHATLVMEYVVEVSPVVELIFAQPFYTGTYTDADGLIFTTPISLTDGYDGDVQFDLNGDDSRWFTLVGSGNSQVLSVLSPIPAPVLQNNQQLVFVVEALRPGSTTTTATIVISLTAEYTEGLVLGFDQITYRGSLENNQVSTVTPITISEGYVPGVQVTLHGDLRDYFETNLQGATVTVTLRSPIPEQSIPANRMIILEMEASAPSATPAHATLVMEYVVEVSPVVELIFAQPFYTGTYTDADGLIFTTPISLTDGYDGDVQFDLNGDDSRWFTLVGSGNSQVLSVLSPIPAPVLQNNQQLVFVVEALRPGSTTTTATIVISLTAEYIEGLVLGFDQITYRGSLENNQVSTVIPITISEGYVPGVQVTLHGDLRDYFETTLQGATVTVTLRSPIPEQSIPANRMIILEMEASAPSSTPAHATLVMEYVVEVSPVVELIFAQPFYTGTYTDADGLIFTTPISLTDGYDGDVQFDLNGDDSRWFTLVGSGNSQILSVLSPIPAPVLQNNQQLVFVVEALRPGSTTTTATIVISLTAEYIEGLVLGFDQITYRGSLENNQVSTVIPITISEGYVPGVQVTLHGDLRDYFETTLQGATVTVTLRSPIPEQSIPANRMIILEMEASAPSSTPAHATLVIEYIVEVSPVVELIFAQPFYTGTYTDDDGLTFTTPISLTDGYDEDVQFDLNGDDSRWFTLVGSGNSQVLSVLSPIPAPVLQNNQQLVFVVEALRPGSTTTTAPVVINLLDSHTESEESFEKVLFEGVIRNGVVSHETIRITGFEGTLVDLEGVHSSLFVAELKDAEVTVRAAGPLTLPAQITHIPLELRSGNAEAVLLLDISQSEVPTPVVVTFSSASYAIRVEITDTGVVGQVEATADNREAVLYSLQLDNVHLQERLSIDDDGTLRLSAPVNSGIYTFQVVATTVYTEETGTATVFLTSEAITVCGDDIVMPPLIVLDRDEEESHYNLINLYEGCRFSLTNRWPSDQPWVYVNETGLHTRAIDREDQSIAFMTLSQVQVEIILQCDTDATRVKRSLTYDSPDPYNYGSNKWVLADTIPYNSRRSLVNLIVNDINDNAPIFVEKEREPIAVGYPVAGLEEIVLPRSLAELQATDADIGENAALVYSSSEPSLAVSPSTGFVHIRDGANLENNARFTVDATDRNGQGLTGTIDIVVKLLDESNILVVTVRDEFLNNEANVLSRMSESLGYEIKVLRSVVISEDEINEEATRKKRDISSATGASLQLYVYGLIDREPVSVERLITDITNAEVAQVNIASTISLEDHLAGQEICVIPGRDTGLLAATIVLSVLLFIVLVLIAVWFFLRWRRNHNYGRFNDTDSFTSQIEPKPIEVLPKPRLNIEELKKSERRLQEMLDAPIEEVSVEPTSSRKDAVVEMPPFAEPNSPIIIQSMDKLKYASDELSEDEFGEIKNPKPKSVVTFNENVEKIIHVEDTDVAEASPSTGFEIYKL